MATTVNGHHDFVVRIIKLIDDVFSRVRPRLWTASRLQVIYNWLVVWNMFIFPCIGNNNPN